VTDLHQDDGGTDQKRQSLGEDPDEQASNEACETSVKHCFLDARMGQRLYERRKKYVPVTLPPDNCFINVGSSDPLEGGSDDDGRPSLARGVAYESMSITLGFRSIVAPQSERPMPAPSA
jgi:hypothetical protein